MKLAPDFKIEAKGSELTAVFNVKTEGKGGKPLPKTIALDEHELTERMQMIQGGGKDASIEQRALFALQRQAQMAHR